MKKGTKRNNIGEDKVREIAKNEKDAVYSFFFQPISEKPKKQKTVKDVADDVVKKAKQKVSEEKEKISLAVPLDVEVPKVQELLRSGAGLSYNAHTEEVKEVTQGVNAAKGRGVINNKRKATKQLSPSEIAAALENDFSDEEKQETEKQVQSEPAGDDEDVPQATLTEEFLKDLHENELQNNVYTVEKSNDPIVYKPNYADDVLSYNTVTTLLRSRSNAEKQKNVPSFYIRRNTTPGAIELPKPKEKHKLQKVEKNKKPADVEEREDQVFDDEITSQKWATDYKIFGKIMTFHSDGTFEWPRKSAFKCWNCCENFDNPPAMIPRYYNWKHRFYEVYGNFCSWSCAKRFASDTEQEFFSEVSPSLDHFAWKFFGEKLPIPMAPSRFLLDSFSSFGMPLEEYRSVGKNRKRDGVIAENYAIIQPPVIPYELMVVWDERKPKRKAIKKGFDPVKKRRFEEQMSGSVPVPNMPKPMVKKTTIVKDHVRNNTTTKTVVSTKKSEKNLFTLLSNEK